MKFSIVTPVYNSFSYMEHYLRTVEKLSDEVEIVLVDDCSTDDSYEKLYEYKEKSPKRIKLLKMPRNGGPGLARNMGMEHASGDWIVFLDSDDSLCEDFFVRLDKVITERDPDCVIYDSELYDQQNNRLNKEKRSVYGKPEGYFTAKEAIAYSIPGIRKCFKRALLRAEGIRFSAYRRAEDFLFYTMLFSGNPDMKIYYTRQRLYRIHQREGSLSRNAKIENTIPAIFDYLNQNLPKEYEGVVTIVSVRLYLYGGLLLLCGNNAPRREICAYIEEYEAKHINWYRSEGMNILDRYKKVFLILARHRMVFLMRMYASLHRYLTTR